MVAMARFTRLKIDVNAVAESSDYFGNVLLCSEHRLVDDRIHMRQVGIDVGTKRDELIGAYNTIVVGKGLYDVGLAVKLGEGSVASGRIFGEDGRVFCVGLEIAK